MQCSLSVFGIQSNLPICLYIVARQCETLSILSLLTVMSVLCEHVQKQQMELEEVARSYTE